MTGDNYFLSLQTAQNASDASSIFNESKKAKASVPTVDEAPTSGKSIPILLGAVKLTGDVIWIRTYRNKKSECICDVAICFGRNPFGRPMKLMSLAQGGSYIYQRDNGDVVDPPKTVRFYDGTQTEVDPTIVKYEGADKTPAFKGHVYAVLIGVKLGDVTANLTDDGTDTNKPVDECDADLAGVDLVYDETARLYYGLRDRMTGNSTIIVSDGCHILSEKPISSPFALDEYLFGPGTVWVDTIFPIRCSGLVLVTCFTTPITPDGYFPPPWFNPPPGEGYAHWTGTCFSYLLDPWSGGAIVGPEYYGFDELNRAGLAMNGLQKTSVYESMDPASADIEWLTSYPLPGGQSAVLRLYDKTDCLATSGRFTGADEPVDWILDPGGNPVSLAGGNVAAHIFDLPAGQYDFLGDVGRVRTNYGGDDSFAPKQNRFNVRRFPDVDELMHCKTTRTEAKLAGIKKADNVCTVYVIYHSESGVSVHGSATITMPFGFTVGSLNFDKANEWILFEGTAPSGGLYTNRVYYVSILNLLTGYSVIASGYTKMLGHQTGIAWDGYVPVTNDDASKIGAMDPGTGDVLPIYDGPAPSGNPVVDLNAQTFTLPTIDGVIAYNAALVTAGEISVASIIADCCALKGYDSGDLAFQNVSSFSVLGLLISSTIRLSDLFNRLGALFGFTFVETDRQLKFLRKRTGSGFALDAVLTDADLVRSDSGDASAIRTINRAGANNALGGMDLEFMNPSLNYENDTIKIRRPDGSFNIGSSSRIETLSVPVTIKPDTAYSLLYESFYSSIHKQTRVAFTVMPHRARIEPGDCLSVTVDGVTTVGIAVRVVMREDFAQEIEIESCMEFGETSSPIPVYPDPNNGRPPKIYGRYIDFEIPYLSRADVSGAETFIQYGGLTTDSSETWGGADLYSSVDGTNFTKIAEYTNDPMAVAEASSPLVYEDGLNASRTQQTLDIYPRSGDFSAFLGRVAIDGGFEAQTYLQQKNGHMIAAYGRPGAWELISWQYAFTSILDGSITLSGIERGLYGTHLVYSPATNGASEYIGGRGNTHQFYDQLCLLDPAAVLKFKHGLGDAGRRIKYGAATNSVGLDRAIKDWRNIYGYSNKLAPIANLRAHHVQGTGNIAISFDTTSQVAGGWPQNGSVNPPLSPVRYKVLFYCNGSTELVDVGYVEHGRVTATSTLWGSAFGSGVSADSVSPSNRWIEVLAYDPNVPGVDPDPAYVGPDLVTMASATIQEGKA